MSAHAQPTEGGETPIGKERDVASFHDYPGVQANEGEPVYNQSRNPGRIWTDKTVFATPEDLAGQGDDDMEVLDDELVVALSAKGSTRQIESTREVAIDLVLVLDNSASMRQCVGSSDNCNTASTYQSSRAYAMVEGVNAAITRIVAADPNARIGIVEFGNQSSVLYQLGAPQQVAGTGQYVAFTPPVGNSPMTIRTATSAPLVVGGATAQSTNIQQGIFTGMNLLATQSGVSGGFQRIPSTIVFSDGEPTLSSTSTSWWNITGTGTHGPLVPGNNQYYGNGFKAAMTAAYMKNRITDVYNDEAYNEANSFDPVEARVYTIGLGVNALTTNGRDLALATFDPSSNLGSTTNAMFAGFTNAFAQYATGRPVRVPVNGNNPANPNVHYDVNHPSGGAEQYDVADLRYNESFDDPDTAEDLIEVFERIASEVVQDSPNLPVDTETANPNADGYVTFTDPLGDFMRVTDVTRITYCSLLQDEPDQTDCEPVTFEQKTVTEQDGVRTYTFEGEYQANDLFDATSVSNIIITVETNPALAVGDVVTVRIPVALLPMRDTHVVEDGSGDPVEMSWYASHPVHVYYKAAPKPDVAAAIANPEVLNEHGYGDGDALAAYIAEHSVDGTVRFYSNDFEASGTGEVTARSEASFRPAPGNDYYRYANDTIIYDDEAGENPVDEDTWDGMDDGAALYREITTYTREGDGSVTKARVMLPTSKGALLAGQHGGLEIAAVDGVMVAPAGLYALSPRVYGLDLPKCAEDAIDWVDNTPQCTDPSGNLTDTDPMVRESTIIPGDAQSVRHKLGNNGWLSYAVPGSLVISKEVEHAAGLSPDPDEEFTFEVALADVGGGPLGGEFEYTTHQADGAQVGDGMIGDGGTLTLTNDQYAVIVGLPDGASYQVAEVTPPPPGYTLASPEDNLHEGDIATPQEAPPRAEFVNAYTVGPSVTTTPAVSKELTGRDWLAGDEFTVDLCPVRSGSPVPDDADPSTGCAARVLTGETPSSTFGDLVFTAPGVFDYTISERDGALTGVAYSLAEYRWTVTVEDDQAGELEATATLTRIRDDDGAIVSQDVEPPAVLTNAFEAGDASLPLRIEKLVNDLALAGDGDDQLRPPALAHDFRFQVLDTDPPADTPAPTFDDQTEVVVQNAPGSSAVISPALSFTGDHVGHTYYYNVAEVPGTTPNVEMWGDRVWFFRIEVEVDEMGEDAVVDPIVTYCDSTPAEVDDDPWGGCDPDGGTYGALSQIPPRIVNDYAPDSGELPLAPTKTLQGRPWLDGDAFTFELAANDAPTEAAIEAGDVTLPEPASVTLAGPVAPGDQPAPVVFDPIEFARVGTYSFRITETLPSPPGPGMAYDTHTLVYDVTVTENYETGVLDAVAEVRGGAVDYVNQYRSTVQYTGLEVVKTLAGRDMDIGEFTFTVSPLDEASRVKANMDSMAGRTFSNEVSAASESPLTMLRLPNVTFTQDDLGQTFGYQIVEQPGSAAGVTYDDTVHTVTIQPLYDEATGALYVLTDANGTEYDSRDDMTPAVAFVNTYTAASAEATVEFTKALTGRDWEDGDAFVFELTPLDDAPAPAETQVTVGSDEPGVDGDESLRAGAFGPISFDAPGTYQYEIRELVPDPPAPGMTYDAHVSTVVVEVTDDGSGVLQTQVHDDGTHRFDNYFRHDWQFEILKTLTGRDMIEGEFTFQVMPRDQASADLAGIPLEGLTFANPAGEDGVTVLMARTAEVLLAAGDDGSTFCYAYSEVVPDPPLEHVVYDETTYEICATVTEDDGIVRLHSMVTDADTGELVEEYHNSSIDVPMVYPRIEFANSYVEPSPATWTVHKSSDPPSGYTVPPGTVITYTVTAERTGEGIPHDVEVVDDLAEVIDEAELVEGSISVSTGVASVDGTTLTWTIPELDGAATLTYQVRIDADAHGAEIHNAVTSPGSEPCSPGIAFQLVQLDLVPPDAPDPACDSTTHHTPPVDPGDPPPVGPGDPPPTDPPTDPPGGPPTDPRTDPRGGLSSDLSRDPARDAPTAAGFGDRLPRTGVDSGFWMAVGLAALAAGLALLIATRLQGESRRE